MNVFFVKQPTYRRNRGIVPKQSTLQIPTIYDRDAIYDSCLQTLLKSFQHSRKLNKINDLCNYPNQLTQMYLEIQSKTKYGKIL